MTQKNTNPNFATIAEISEIKGIGKATASKIAKFLNDGGEFNTLEEFQAVAKLQPSYLELAKENLVFTKDPGPAHTPPIVSIPHAPDPVYIPPLQFPGKSKETRFSFRVRFSGRDGGYLGYRLAVEYQFSWFHLYAKGSKKTRQKEYNLSASAEQAITVSYPEIANLGSAMRFVLFSPAGDIVYEGSLQVEEEKTVTIELLPPTAQDVLVKLARQATVNYSGYKVKAKALIDKGSAGLDTALLSHDIGNDDEIHFDFASPGQISELTITVLSNHGLPISNQTYEWSEIPEQNGMKELSIELPLPQTISFSVQLAEDPDSELNPYHDHLALVSYQAHGLDDDNISRHIEKSFLINSDGLARVDLRQYGRVSDIMLKVQAPGGEILGQREITLADIDGNNEVAILIAPQELAGFRGAVTLPERPKKMTGRVIDLKGERKFEDAQVVIYGSRVEEPQEDDFVPLLIVNTEKQGYFIAPTPEGTFRQAIAKIGLPRRGAAEPEIFEIPVRLEEDEVMAVNDEGDSKIESRLFFPANLILVVDSIGADEEQCSDNDCNIDFHRKKMVLDEFSFYSVVRTTEPAIQGYTLEEDGDMTVQDIIDIVPISPDASDDDKNIPLNYHNKSINKNILLKHINDKRGLTFTTLQKAINESNARKLREAVRPQRQIKAFGRHQLDLDHAIDWDEDPTIYQATSLAHGHLLHFKQEWRNDGYSLGDLLYSLPLAPGQKKQIVVFDWDRKEAASKAESTGYNESLYNSLGRDRDINEIVTGSLAEQTRGGSSANTSSFSAGLGGGAMSGAFSAVIGVSGGSSKASSKAWQNSSRSTALNDLQKLRDNTVQSANGVRSQRSTVIQTANQGERFSAKTETVANYNHCHSMTIQYFEVLRHMEAQQRLSSVQECLFVPLIMSTFDNQKILRWREDLYGFVRSRALRRGFAAIERIENDYEGSDLPEGIFAAEDIDSLEGHLYLRFDLPTPVDLEKLEEEDEIIDSLSRFQYIFPGISRHFARVHEAERQKRDEIFQRYIAPEIAAAVVEHLEIRAVINDSWALSNAAVYLPLDTTLTSSFRNGRSHYVSLNPSGNMPALSREEIKAVVIKKSGQTILADGSSLAKNLPDNARVIVESGAISYRSKHHTGFLFKKNGIKDDLIGYATSQGENEFVRISTPLNRRELRNPKNEDLETASNLQDHLNDNLEFFHKAIWLSMSPERRFMFLDGIQVTDYADDKYKLGIVRSVASVVENKVIGIVGNSLVMPVSSGCRLDPNSRGNEVDLHALYKPLTPIEPIHVSIPTKGVFAEAVMGSCNSCEKIEDNRFWKWEEHPVPDSPTELTPVSTDSRRSAPLDTSSTPLANPVVNIQNAPAAPDPAGVGAAANLLQNANFKDITGLEGNQKNAIEALKASYETTREFGSKAAEMASLGAKLEAIKDARANNQIDDETMAAESKKAIENSNKKGAGSDVKSTLEDMKAVQHAIDSNQIPREQGNKLLDAQADNLRSDKSSVLDSEPIQARLKGGGSLMYEGHDEKISIADAAMARKKKAASALQKFLVHFVEPETFDHSDGRKGIPALGRFGFDWLKDEYIHPIKKVEKDNDEKTVINDFKPLCKDPAKLKALYLKDADEVITPHGRDYYPAWLAILPSNTKEAKPYSSYLNKHGANISLTIEMVGGIDELVADETELVFETDNPHLKITPKANKLKQFLKKGKETIVLDSSKNLEKTVYHFPDAINVACLKGVVKEHTAINVIARLEDEEEKVGKLMVYANEIIPKVEVVVVKVKLNNKTPSLIDDAESFQNTLKRLSFNQALIRAEIVKQEVFDLTGHDDDPDVNTFLTKYNHEGYTVLDSDETLCPSLGKLYERYGRHLETKEDGTRVKIAASKRTFMFLVDLDGEYMGEADTDVEYVTDKDGNRKLKSFIWGNYFLVLRDGLDHYNTFTHELGHTLGLYHPFCSSAEQPVEFYQGYLDFVMDYDGTTSSDANPYEDKNQMLRFAKYEWDILRQDRSLIFDYEPRS
ncbi:MAG: helix-hairpin-helix domain-containing protein [Thermodesulfobacteriota bacterium]